MIVEVHVIALLSNLGLVNNKLSHEEYEKLVVHPWYVRVLYPKAIQNEILLDLT
jgi:siderophore synthetase component